MEIKMTLIFHITLIRIAKIKKKPQAIEDAGKDMEKEWQSYISGEITGWYKHCGYQFGNSLENWK